MKASDISPGMQCTVVLLGKRAKAWVEYLSGPLMNVGGVTWVVRTDGGQWLRLPARRIHEA